MSTSQISQKKQTKQTVKSKRKISAKIKSGKKPKAPSIMEQYMVFYEKAVNKYGPKTAVLCQVGDFYECYTYDDDPKFITNAEDLAAVMDIVICKYRKESELSLSNPRRCGFQRPGLSKFKNMLLDENYTVVIVNQIEDPTAKPDDPKERQIAEIHSPGVSDQPIGFNYNNVICIVIENQNRKDRLIHRIDQYEVCVGMAAIDVSTNKSTVYESASSRTCKPELAANEIYRFLQTHNCRELIVYLENFLINDEEKEEKALMRYWNNILELQRYNIHHFQVNAMNKEFKKLRYQNQLLSKVFGSDVCGIKVSPIEYLQLEMYPNSVLAYCCLIDFIYQRNESYLKDLEPPMWWKNDTHLVLTHNAIKQLDIVSRRGKRGKNSSLFNIVNNTITNQGKRLLETQLLHPLLNHEELETQYSQIEQLRSIGNIDYIRKQFRGITDFERKHRQVQLQKLQPHELNELIESYGAFIEMFDWLYMKINEVDDLKHPQKYKELLQLLPDETTLTRVRQFYNKFSQVYNLEALKRTTSYKSVQVNLFNTTIDPEIDEICSHIGNFEQRLQVMRAKLCHIVDRVGPKADKLVTLRITKKQSMFRTSIIGAAILKFYQKQIRNALHYVDDNLEKVNIIHYANPTELVQHQGHKITDSDILDWARKKKIEFFNTSENSDEDSDDSHDDSLTNLTENLSDPHTKLLSPQDMKLILSLSFRSNKSNVNVTTPKIDDAEEGSDEYVQQLIKIMFDRSHKFLKEHFHEYQYIIHVFNDLSSKLDVIQSHVKTAIRYQYNRPEVVPYQQGKPSFIDIKGFRHPIIERIQDDIEYIKNDLKLGDDPENPYNSNGLLLYAMNNSGKSASMKALSLNIVLAQAGCFVAADSMRFRPFKNIITRLDGVDDMFKGQGSFAVEMSELRTVANQSGPNSLVVGDEICRGTEQDSAVSIMASTIEYLCNKTKANFIFSSHYHELLNFKEIEQLQHENKLKVQHLKALTDPDTGAIVYEYKLADGVGPTVFGIEVARAMGYNTNICDRAIYYRNKRLGKKQHFLSTKTSGYNSNVYMDQCSVDGCEEDPDDTHHEKQQHTADEHGSVGHFHKNRKHNLIPLCKKHHNLADKQLLNFEFKMTSEGVKLFCKETTK